MQYSSDQEGSPHGTSTEEDTCCVICLSEGGESLTVCTNRHVLHTHCVRSLVVYALRNYVKQYKTNCYSEGSLCFVRCPLCRESLDINVRHDSKYNLTVLLNDNYVCSGYDRVENGWQLVGVDSVDASPITLMYAIKDDVVTRVRSLPDTLARIACVDGVYVS